jgi:hypothetical protein
VPASRRAADWSRLPEGICDMIDVIDRARDVIDLLERNDVDALRARCSERLRDWSAAEWVRDAWMPRLNDFAGAERRIIRGWAVSDLVARFIIEGDRGQAFVTVRLDAEGMLEGLGVDADDRDGGFGVIIQCGADRCDELQTFYAKLVRAPLGFGEGGDSPAPRWPDPAYPQQMHLDILVPDLDAAEEVVLADGATRLQDRGGFRTYADPLGHPFCLYPDTSGEGDLYGRLGVLARVVIDCPDPAALASFYSGLLEMPRTMESSVDRVVIAREDGKLPMLGMQRVQDYVPPRWPDPRYPAQLHFDIKFDDRETAERRAIALGATLLPPQGGSCPVYADPAGHPFCLCVHAG